MPRGTCGAARSFTLAVPILILILVAILIAQIGFWDTLGAVLGATAMVILLVLLILGVAALVARHWFLKIKRGL